MFLLCGPSISFMYTKVTTQTHLLRDAILHTRYYFALLSLLPLLQTYFICFKTLHTALRHHFTLLFFTFRNPRNQSIQYIETVVSMCANYKYTHLVCVCVRRISDCVGSTTDNRILMAVFALPKQVKSQSCLLLRFC